VELKTDNKTEKSFTLIELLMVIAIIGILAGIVLVALGGARDKARDARIISDMAQIRIQAEIIFSKYGNYSRVHCNGDINIQTLCDDIADQGGQNLEGGSGPGVQAYSPPLWNKYCVEVQLNSGKFWCVDYGLRSAQYDTDPACSSGIFICE